MGRVDSRPTTGRTQIAPRFVAVFRTHDREGLQAAEALICVPGGRIAGIRRDPRGAGAEGLHALAFELQSRLAPPGADGFEVGDPRLRATSRPRRARRRRSHGSRPRSPTTIATCSVSSRTRRVVPSCCGRWRLRACKARSATIIGCPSRDLAWLRLVTSLLRRDGQPREQCARRISPRDRAIPARPARGIRGPRRWRRPPGSAGEALLLRRTQGGAAWTPA